jgi:hypothetical protein
MSAQIFVENILHLRRKNHYYVPSDEWDFWSESLIRRLYLE